MKRLAFIIAGWMLILNSASDLQAQEGCYPYRIKTESLNIREQQTASSDKVGQYNKSEVICVLYIEKDWGRTEHGWIFLKYAEPVENDLCQPYQLKTEVLNIRANNSIKSEIVGQYKSDDRFCVLEQKEGWVRTEKGWVSPKYVKPVAEGKEKGSFRAGISVALQTIPEEKDLKNDSVPLGVFLDWEAVPDWVILRFGYMKYGSKFSSSNVDARIESSAYQLSYGISPNLGFKDWDAMLMVGVAYVESKLDINPNKGDFPQTEAGPGAIAGISIDYNIDSISIGIQGILISRKAEFKSLESWVGSSQTQLYVAYRF